MIELTRLDNGIRVVSENLPGVLSATVGIWVARGARHENADQNGIAHFLEHMAFKGTDSRNARQIAETIENVGGYLNAYTARDVTAYYARVLGEDVPLAFDILSDILVNPSFAEAELEVERGVILQEIGQTLDTPDDIIFDWLGEASFPDQALGRPILGPPEHIRRFTASDFRDFVGAHYGGRNLVVAASGAVDHDALVSQVEEAFAALSYRADPVVETANFNAGQRRVEKSLEQVHFAMSLPAPSLGDDRQYAAALVNSILGGGMASRLFQSIREERGLCYSIYSSLDMMADHGTMTIYAGTSADGIDELMGATSDELREFAAQLEDSEIARAKAQMRAGSVMALENVGARVERMARQMIYFDKIIPIEESLTKIDAVSRDDMAAIGDEMLRGDPQMVLYGPIIAILP